jgi:hypothetical protein
VKRGPEIRHPAEATRPEIKAKGKSKKEKVKEKRQKIDYWCFKVKSYFSFLIPHSSFLISSPFAVLFFTIVHDGIRYNHQVGDHQNDR